MAPTKQYLITEQQLTILKQLWPYLEPRFGGVIGKFYDMATSDPIYGPFFKDRPIKQLQQAQFNHWKDSFVNGLTDDYFSRMERIGSAHARIGLKPELYVSAYNSVLELLVREIREIFKPTLRDFLARRTRKKLAFNVLDAIAAVRALVMADISVGVSAYYDHYQNVQNKAIGTIESSVESFCSDITERFSTTATATAEMDASIADISTQLSQNAKLTEQTNTITRETGELVANLNKELSQIQDIADLIMSLSEQTNLLALNAAIEAARAGDAGRGFAVVADEVKKLANSTNKATEDVRTQIAKLETGAAKTFEAIEKIANSVNDVAEATVHIAATMEQQKGATHEISQAITEANSEASTLSSRIHKEIGETLQEGLLN